MKQKTPVEAIKSLIRNNIIKYVGKSDRVLSSDPRVVFLMTLNEKISKNMPLNELKTLIKQLEQVKFVHDKKEKTLGTMMQEKKLTLLNDDAVQATALPQVKPFNSPYWRFTSGVHFDDTLMQIHDQLKNMLPAKDIRYAKDKNGFVSSPAISKWIEGMIAPRTDRKDYAVQDFIRSTKINGQGFKTTQDAEKEIHTFTGADQAQTKDDIAKAKALEQFIRDVGGQSMLVLQNEYPSILKYNDKEVLPGTSGGFTINWTKENNSLFCNVTLALKMPMIESQFHHLNDTTGKLTPIKMEEIQTYFDKKDELPDVVGGSAKIKLETVQEKNGEYKVIPRVVDMNINIYAKDLDYKSVPTPGETKTTTTTQTTTSKTESDQNELDEKSGFTP